MVKLDFNLERDVPQLTSKVLLITGGMSSGFLIVSFIIIQLDRDSKFSVYRHEWSRRSGGQDVGEP